MNYKCVLKYCIYLYFFLTFKFLAKLFCRIPTFDEVLKKFLLNVHIYTVERYNLGTFARSHECWIVFYLNKLSTYSFTLYGTHPLCYEIVLEHSRKQHKNKTVKCGIELIRFQENIQRRLNAKLRQKYGQKYLNMENKEKKEKKTKITWLDDSCYLYLFELKKLAYYRYACWYTNFFLRWLKK